MPVNQKGFDIILAALEQAWENEHKKANRQLVIPVGEGFQKALDEAIKQDLIKNQNNMPNKDIKKAVPKAKKQVGQGLLDQLQRAEFVADNNPGIAHPVEGVVRGNDNGRIEVFLGEWKKLAHNDRDDQVFGAGIPIGNQIIEDEVVEDLPKKEPIQFVKKRREEGIALPGLYGYGAKKDDTPQYHPDKKYDDIVKLSLDHTANIMAAAALNESMGSEVIVFKNDSPIIPEELEDQFTFIYDKYYDLLMTMKKG